MCDLPAWIQAIGSLIALGIAVWVAREAKLTDDRNRKNDYRRLLESIVSLGGWAIKALGDLERAMPFNSDNVTRDQYFHAFRPAAIEAVLRALRDVPFHQLGDAELAETTLDLENKLVTFKAGLDALGSRLNTPSDVGTLPSQTSGLLNALKDRVSLENSSRSLVLRAQQLLGRAPTPQHLITPISPTNPLAGA